MQYIQNLQKSKLSKFKFSKFKQIRNWKIFNFENSVISNFIQIFTFPKTTKKMKESQMQNYQKLIKYPKFTFSKVPKIKNFKLQEFHNCEIIKFRKLQKLTMWKFKSVTSLKLPKSEKLNIIILYSTAVYYYYSNSTFAIRLLGIKTMTLTHVWTPSAVAACAASSGFAACNKVPLYLLYFVLTHVWTPSAVAACAASSGFAACNKVPRYLLQISLLKLLPST